MSAVKVGDKVKSLVTEHDVKTGSEYVVTSLLNGSVYVVDDIEDEYYLLSNKFELVQPGEKFFAFSGTFQEFSTQDEAEEHVKAIHTGSTGSPFTIGKVVRKVKAHRVTTVTLEDAE